MRAIFILFAAALVASTGRAEPKGNFVAVEERLMERATKISIPRVDFKDTTLADALEFLREEARTHDPKHQGIPIEVHVAPWEMREYLPGSKISKLAPPGGWPLYEPLKQRVTFSLNNTSLADALHYAAALVGCRVGASRTALTILPPVISVEPMVTHTIPLAAAPKAEIDKIRADPKQFFIKSGTIFNGSAACSLEDGGTTLVVTNTLDQIDLIHTILESLVPYKPLKKSK